MKRLGLVCAISLSLAGAAHAGPLYRITGKSASPAPRATVANAVEAHTIELDVAALAAAPPRLTLPLPDGRTLDVERARHLVHGPELESWSGNVPSFDPTREHASYVRLSRRPSGITGVVILPDGERFEILPDVGKRHQLVRIGTTGAPPAGASAADSCGIDAAPDPVLSAAKAPAIVPSLESPAPQFEVGTSALPTTIDLLAVYSDRFLSFEPESTVRTFIQDSVIDANEIFWNSGVNAQYAIRFMGPITGAQPPLTGIDNDLSWLNNAGSAAGSEIAQLRDTYGADMVALFVPLSDGTLNACGIANLRLSNGCNCTGLTGTPRPAFDQRAFSVVRNGCGLTDFTVAHEFGHNYGMGHGPGAFSDALFPYARGHVLVDNASASVMACTGYTAGENIIAGVCNRIPYFSDPTITVGGVPAGVTDQRDNARVADQQVGPYAAFRPTRTTGVPTVRINSPQRGLPYWRDTSITYSATASDPEQGNLTSSIRWRVDGVLTGTIGGSFTTSFSTIGPHTVTATVTDNTGLVANWHSPLVITPPPPSTTISWITPAEASFGPPGTLTVAGTARDGTGGVQLRWRDSTAGGAWTTVAYQPVPDGAGGWVNSIPSPVNKCHTYQAQSFYSGAQSTVFSWFGASSGYCTETARVIWIQPQPLAGFGPASHLIVAGEARNAPAGYGVQLSYRNVTLNGAWTTLSYAPPPDASGIWYNAIPASNYTHQYDVRVTYDVITSSTCRYAGGNAITWC